MYVTDNGMDISGIIEIINGLAELVEDCRRSIQDVSGGLCAETIIKNVIEAAEGDIVLTLDYSSSDGTTRTEELSNLLQKCIEKSLPSFKALTVPLISKIARKISLLHKELEGFEWIPDPQNLIRQINPVLKSNDFTNFMIRASSLLKNKYPENQKEMIAYMEKSFDHKCKDSCRTEKIILPRIIESWSDVQTATDTLVTIKLNVQQILYYLRSFCPINACTFALSKMIFDTVTILNFDKKHETFKKLYYAKAQHYFEGIKTSLEDIMEGLGYMTIFFDNNPHPQESQVLSSLMDVFKADVAVKRYVHVVLLSQKIK